MFDFHKKHARQSIVHANEAVELLKMSKQIHEAKRKGLIDETTASEAVSRLNTEAAVEIEAALRLQKMALVENKTDKGN